MFNLQELITTAGYFGLFGIVFAETGLLVGFFLPGDSLLFTAGILASRGILNIYYLAPLLFAAAVLGDNTGYLIGHRFGKRLFHREDSLLFHKEHLVRAKNFYEKYGKKAIILARFMPIIRTFSAVIAGIGDMHYPTFLIFDIIGGLLWAVGVTMTGYLLGNSIPSIDRYLLPIIVIIVLVSIYPALKEVFGHKEHRDKIWSQIVSLLKRKQSS